MTVERIDLNERGSSFSKGKMAINALAAVEPWVLHDLRRTYATNLAALRVSPHVIEKLLNHVSGQISGVAAIYNRPVPGRNARGGDQMGGEASRYFGSILAEEGFLRGVRRIEFTLSRESF
jgi:hypothetical protein